MGKNQDQNKENMDNGDKELEEARKSMGNRMDSDPTPEPKPEDKPEAPKPPVADPKPAPENPKPEEKKDIVPDKPNPDAQPNDDANKKPIKRGERFIPMAQYHDEQRIHKQELADRDKKIAELSAIASQGNTPKKDDDIEAFMAKTGFDRETVEGLVSIAEKRVLTPELKEAIKKAESIVSEAENDASFSDEFKRDGEPALKAQFPSITSEQLEKAKDLIDRFAHTAKFHTSTLDYIIFKNKSEIEKLISGQEENPNPTPPADKKTIEPNRMGQGKPVSLTAKDFSGKKDFSELNDMDPTARNELVKSFDDKTYENFSSWVASQEGMEIMRNGRRIQLK